MGEYEGSTVVDEDWKRFLSDTVFEEQPGHVTQIINPIEQQFQDEEEELPSQFSDQKFLQFAQNTIPIQQFQHEDVVSIAPTLLRNDETYVQTHVQMEFQIEDQTQNHETQEELEDQTQVQTQDKIRRNLKPRVHAGPIAGSKHVKGKRITPHSVVYISRKFKTKDGDIICVFLVDLSTNQCYKIFTSVLDNTTVKHGVIEMPSLKIPTNKQLPGKMCGRIFRLMYVISGDGIDERVVGPTFGIKAGGGKEDKTGLVRVARRTSRS